MSALIRKSSIDALKTSLSSEHNVNLDNTSNAATILQQWLQKRAKLLLLRKTLLHLSSSIISVMDIMNNLSTHTMEEVQMILAEPSFTSSLSTILQSFPIDPTLQKKNSMARSVRFISSAFVIKLFASTILTVSKDYGHPSAEPDTGDEAIHCKTAATMLFHSLFSLLKSVSSSSIILFRDRQVAYRFSVRYFIEALQVWERLDTDRLCLSLQAPFLEIYSMLLSLDIAFQKGEMLSHDYEENKSLTLMQVNRIEGMLIELLGTRGRCAIEELKAYCESNKRTSEDHSNFPPSITLSKEESVPQPVELKEISSTTTEFVSSVNSILNTYIHFEFSESENNLVYSLTQATDIPLDTIIYEVCLYGKYYIPPEAPIPRFTLFTYSDIAATQDTLTTAGPPSDIKALLKSRLLQLMGDKLICSLRSSSIVSPMEVTEGMLVSVSLTERDSSTGMFPNPDYVSAKVLQVNGDGTLAIIYLCDHQHEIIQESRLVLSSDGPHPGPFISALSDVCDRILSLTPRQRTALSVQLNAAVNLPLLQQMISSQAIEVKDIMSAFLFILQRIMDLQAPASNEATESWRRALLSRSLAAGSLDEFLSAIPSFFEFCTICISQIKNDMSNYYIQLLVPTLMAKGPLYLSSFFSNALSLRLVSLDRAITIFRGVITESLIVELEDAGVSISHVDLLTAIRGTEQLKQNYCTAAVFVWLLQRPFRLDSPQGLLMLPETLLRDASKLALLRDEVDILALISTVLIVVRQTLGQWRAQMSVDEAVELQGNLSSLVRGSHVVLTDIMNECERCVRVFLSRRKLIASLVPTWQESMCKALTDTVQDDNVVRNLFSKRIFKLVFRILLDQHFQDKLQIYSLSSPPQVKIIWGIALSTKKLFKVHLATPLYRDLYDAIYKYCL